jgi:hypothetical protein
LVDIEWYKSWKLKSITINHFQHFWLATSAWPQTGGPLRGRTSGVRPVHPCSCPDRNGYYLAWFLHTKNYGKIQHFIVG